MHRPRCAAVLLGSAAIMLSAACGSSGSSASPSAVASSTTASAAASDQPTTAAASSTSSASTDGRKPCSHPTAMSGFVKLNSATVAQGETSLNVTIVDCTVDPVNDEDVDYTPTGTATVLVHAGAQIQVLMPDNNLQTVAASWLVNHQVVNTPYFYYQDNAQHQITAMQEIYHP